MVVLPGFLYVLEAFTDPADPSQDLPSPARSSVSRIAYSLQCSGTSRFPIPAFANAPSSCHALPIHIKLRSACHPGRRRIALEKAFKSLASTYRSALPAMQNLRLKVSRHLAAPQCKSKFRLHIPPIGRHTSVLQWPHVSYTSSMRRKTFVRSTVTPQPLSLARSQLREIAAPVTTP